MKKFLKEHPFLAAILLSLILGIILCVVSELMTLRPEIDIGGTTPEKIWELCATLLVGMIGFGGVIIFPFVLTAAEIILLVKGRKDHALYRKGRMFDLVGMTLGSFYSMLYLRIKGMLFVCDWYEQLTNSHIHTPIYTKAQLTVTVVAMVAVAGYLVVNYIPLNKMPPLMLVLGMAAIYMGTVESVVWGIQVFQGEFMISFFCSSR